MFFEKNEENMPPDIKWAQIEVRADLCAYLIITLGETILKLY